MRTVFAELGGGGGEKGGKQRILKRKTVLL